MALDSPDLQGPWLRFRLNELAEYLRRVMFDRAPVEASPRSCKDTTPEVQARMKPGQD